MQSYPFWLFDASGPPIPGVPGFGINVLNPLFGFSSITAPEITAELKEIQPGNWTYKRRVVSKSDVGSVTLSRGVQFFDSDFYSWISLAVGGKSGARRNLVLIHFLTLRPFGQFAEVTGIGSTGNPFSELATRMPGRAWILHHCLPTRYKSGSDFDAKSGDVSIQELDVQPEYVHELTVASTFPLVGAGISVVSAIAG